MKSLYDIYEKDIRPTMVKKEEPSDEMFTVEESEPAASDLLFTREDVEKMINDAIAKNNENMKEEVKDENGN